jgi:TPR repeat protein
LTNSGKNRFWILLTIILLVAFIIIAGGYLILKETDKSVPLESVPAEKKAEKPALPRMVNLPEKKEIIKPPPPPSYHPDAPVLEQARKSLKKGITAADAVVLAKSLPESPERADAAFLLLEYAADSGNAEAAKFVARYYDPADETPSGTIRKNPEIAYEWYMKALTGGQHDVQKQLTRLHQWAEGAAKQGSKEACQLLQNWP